MRWLFAICVLTGTGVAACEASDGFECGLPGSDDGTFKQCSRAKEVCVCATNSCAKRDDATKDCTSGYRYVAKPFASSDVAGECVAAEHIDWRIDQTNEIKSCEALRIDAGSDADIDASEDDGDAGIDSSLTAREEVR